MKSQFDLHLAVLKDQAQLCGISASQDAATFASRFKQEGEVFLTLILPSLALVLEQGLRDGALPEMIPLFKANSKTDRRPAFLHGFWARVFEKDGTLSSTPSIDCVRALRQILYLHSKLKELPTPDKVETAFAQYVQTDKAISETKVPLELYKEFQATSKRLWGVHFRQMERALERDTFLSLGKHGPGAVAQKLSSNGKWRSQEWTERLQSYFPAHEYLTHRGSDYSEFSLLPPGAEIPARVIAVPKTAKSPRIITAEPVFNQFIQQGLSALFARWMNIHPVVSYEYQTPNQLLAQQGSIDQSVATLDLSEASDRVSLTIVKYLLRDTPFLLGAVLACRSSRSVLPDGTIVLLRKFASMGSALTFPIETLVFATIVEMAVKHVEDSSGIVLSRDNVRVYGDDIIIPGEAADECVALLHAFGLKVNVNKSFGKGYFRESCGGDFYHGLKVSPIRTRKKLPRTRRDVDEVVSIVAFRNLYFEQYGLTEFVTSLDTWIERIIPFPPGPKDTAALVRWDYHYSPSGHGGDYQRPFVKACVPQYLIPQDQLDDEAALLKFFWTPFSEDQNHLQRAGRPISAKLRYRKVYL